VADNLPLIMLGFVSKDSGALGVFGFANLLLFLPLFHISVLSQSALPSLVRAANGDEGLSLKICLDSLSRRLRLCVVFWGVLLLVVAALLHFELVLKEYEASAFLIAILVVSLPGRVVILQAGALNVATGSYGRSALMAASEISVITFLFAVIESPSAVFAAAVVVASLVPSLLYGKHLLNGARQRA
jgi:cation transport ATPase